jgi:non-homologous end joining protein Ku
MMLEKLRITDDLSVVEKQDTIRIYSDIEHQMIVIADEELDALIAYLQKRKREIEREESFPA